MSALSVPAKAARLTLPRWLPLLLVFVLAMLLRGVLAANPDVSWGALGRRHLGGPGFGALDHARGLDGPGP
jgi:hypothetical protein